MLELNEVILTIVRKNLTKIRKLLTISCAFGPFMLLILFFVLKDISKVENDLLNIIKFVMILMTICYIGVGLFIYCYYKRLENMDYEKIEKTKYFKNIKRFNHTYLCSYHEHTIKLIGFLNHTILLINDQVYDEQMISRTNKRDLLGKFGKDFVTAKVIYGFPQNSYEVYYNKTLLVSTKMK